MSRVRKPGNKWGNDIKHVSEEVAPSKITRSKLDITDYTKATSLTSWLYLKYDMSYKTYKNKSKSRRAELKEEYLKDTNKAGSLKSEHPSQSEIF